VETQLLATKLRIPPRTHHLVHRARLADTLEQAIPRHTIILLSAPAGYGKTALLADWAASSRFPVAWLSLDADDGDVERFLRYLLAAWEHVQSGIGESPLGMLLGAMAPDRDTVLAAFVNVASDLPGDMVFVLDDLHVIDDTAVHQALTFLLDHLPPTVHVVLSSRGEPPLPLARYRARQQLLELRADDLRFTATESAELLNELMGLQLADEAVASLHDQLEGWPAGLQLAALSLRRQHDAPDILAISGRHRFIVDYLRDDVLARLPDDVRQFLLQTSILERMCGSLCDAVTGRDDSQAMLERLERENLFLTPLDDSRSWFRYHRFFADFVQAELRRRLPAEIAHLHRRAATWHLEHELREPAFDHAVASDDPGLVSLVFERHVNAMLKCGEMAVVARWLDALPAAWFATHPLFGLARAGLLFFAGAFDACVRTVDDIERQLTIVETEESRWQLAMVTAMRCFIACVQNDLERAEALAGRALRDLRAESFSFRASIHHALGDTYRQNGRWDEAEVSYLEALSIADAPGFSVELAVESVHVYGALADLELRQGHLRQAANYWSKALTAIQKPESWGRLELPVIGWVFIRMGELLYEWNELAQAWEHLSRGLERVELGGDVRALIAGYLIAGRLKLAQGDLDAAAAYLERARPLVEDAPFPEWASRFERFQIEFWLARDRLRAAVVWADQMLQSDALQARLEPEHARMAVARVLVVKGDQPSVRRALTLIEQLLQAAEDEGCLGVAIEALALQAVAQWQGGDRAGAMMSLERALRLAEPEGYVRLFADLGVPMTRLLQEARYRDVMPDYVALLLAAAGPTPASRASTGGSVAEPLTDRELEVLELLAAGLTNREIADALVVSSQTVKKHTSNIYGKLGVRSRTEAAARARELQLLR
jgi:LuxR family maltose regulon positive regulatory protein